MEKIKNKKDKGVNEIVHEEKPKSKITLYWEKRERLGARGEIVNMRAVLK